LIIPGEFRVDVVYGVNDPQREERMRKDMEAYRNLAKEYDRRGDVVLRTQAATTWAELATVAERKRAPKYLTWRGRR